MKALQIVSGTSGEYEDRKEWIVGAFFSKRRTDAFIKRLATAYRAAVKKGREREKETDFGYTIADHLKNSRSFDARTVRNLDPSGYWDFGDATWFVSETQLLDEGEEG